MGNPERAEGLVGRIADFFCEQFGCVNFIAASSRRLTAAETAHWSCSPRNARARQANGD